MLKLLLTYFLTFLTSLAIAQAIDSFKISGTVISINNGKPIPYGTIMFSRYEGHQCDSAGHFVINDLQPGQHSLTFTAPGFSKIDTIIMINNSDITDFRFVVYTDCSASSHFNEQVALKDIKAGKPKLLLFSGIAPVYYVNQKNFERKYKITYYDFGCTPDLEECMLAYNRIIFAYLDKTYGNKWRKEVRQDIIGLMNE